MRNYWLKIPALLFVATALSACNDPCTNPPPGAIVVAQCSGIFSNTDTIQVPTDSSGDAPSTFVSREKGATYFATGRAATNLSSARAERERNTARRLELEFEKMRELARQHAKVKAPPENLRQIAVNAPDLLGGFTQLPNPHGAEAYLTARHVLQGTDIKELEKSFAAAGKNLSDFAFFEFKLQGSPIDVVLLVRKTDKHKILKSANNLFSLECEGDGSFPLSLVNDLPIRRTVEMGDLYYSKQFGTVGSEPVIQVSSAEISRLHPAGYAFFLDTVKSNYATARTSGAVVQVTKKSGLEPWRVGGVVECFVPEQKTASGVRIPSAIRVIAGGALLDSEVSPIALDAIALEPRRTHKDCVPIDFRGAGGG